MRNRASVSSRDRAAGFVLAGVVATSSFAGLIFGAKLYGSYSAPLAGLAGQDLVSLFIGVPLLIGAMRHARRGSPFALLVLGATFFYFAYSYFFFVVGGFSALFPVHVAIVSIGLFGLLSVLLELAHSGTSESVRSQ